VTLVVGGQSSKVGKTQVVCALLRALAVWDWTAIKISRHAHGLSGASYSLDEEDPGGTVNDTQRFLAAGARRAYWLRAPGEGLRDALPALTPLLEGHCLIESNSILEFLTPDLYLLVVRPGEPDWKDSALRFGERADALLVNGDPGAPLPWPETPRFAVNPTAGLDPELVKWLHARLKGVV
jgi:hypothetical protein